MLAQEASPPKAKFIDVLGQTGLPRMGFYAGIRVIVSQASCGWRGSDGYKAKDCLFRAKCMKSSYTLIFSQISPP
ncbi:hypothetical protein [Sinorhizobium meliloti]|uniref:hypothetical protein n=1 Tax=Rhizobium meliloti TaxID=382 RepID=UPI000B4A1C37|nr:hypothetical protein [Sinorhizobium meliloti]ASP67374.1 hypothetical protein CDO29_23300 [Sinorhizobium meliloti]MQW99778.1 hypothetical protein [Sinorhizobium meliloti]